jgi:hypothetical protein
MKSTSHSSIEVGAWSELAFSSELQPDVLKDDIGEMFAVTREGWPMLKLR